MNTRIQPKLREAQIIEAAIELAKKIGFSRLTRDGIAEHAGVASGLVSYHLGSMPQIRKAVMSAAIKGQHLEVIAQGMAISDPQAMKAAPELRMRAAQSLTRRM